MKPEEEFQDRYKAAKKHTDAAKDDLREVYKFLFNGREREWDATSKRWQEPDEIFDTTGAEAAIEFAGDLFMYATPDTKDWVEFEVTSTVPEDQSDQVLEAVTAREIHIAEALKSSNYYDVGLEIFIEANVGVVAANIERPSLSKAIEFEPVPLSQLHFTVGPQGPEDRFRERMVYHRDIKRLFPDWTPSEKVRRRLEKPGMTKVMMGYWRNYDDPGNPQWVHSAKVMDEWPELNRVLGPDGNCPLAIGRFNPIPNVPHGRGPGWVMLPELRTIDALRMMILDKMDQIVDPAVIYTRDAVLDLSDGIEAGKAYPSLAAGDAITTVGSEGNLDYGFFTQDDLERRIRRGFYRKPDQPGKTPPSATQFLGQDRDHIKYMGRPGAAVFREFVREMLLRVERLEIDANRLDAAITLNDNDIVRMTPVNPMSRAQDEEDVAQADGLMTAAQRNLGEDAALVIDGTATFRRIKERLGDDLVVIRSNDEIQQVLIQRAQAQAVQQGQQPNES